jgi:hypothetical protein
MRQITSQRSVFSCFWTPRLEVAEATLAQLKRVQGAAQKAVLANAQDELASGGAVKGPLGAPAFAQAPSAYVSGGGSGVKVIAGGIAEVRRLAIAAGVQADIDATAGVWESYAPKRTLRSEEEESQQVVEFISLISMRTADVGSALKRAEELARRMWTGAVCARKSALSALRRLSIIGQGPPL